jgi:hypothetical protein
MYLNDAIIYSRALEEHMEHLRLVLQRLKEEGLKLRLKKCFVDCKKISTLLGYIVSGGKLSISTKKVEAVKEWPIPRKQRKVRIFG